ncbi:MAG: hypothetical protein SPH68_04210 [Candidatus Borkfalkiaceae bacterium]|nr:hypothetical protein [Clostridia bacterium]MDY6223343.1 hypothetical protein [Christensenellaceae bacterium]
MKKSQVEKRIKSEINRFAPSDFLSVRQKIEGRASLFPAQESAEVETHSGGAAAIRRKKTLFSLLAAFTALMLLLLALLPVFYKNKAAEKPFNPAPPLATGGSFFIDVNPSIELEYDAEGTVLSARGLNDDGKVLLSGWDASGKSVDECVNEVFARCVAQGYFTALSEDNAVLVTAESAEGTRDETRTQEIKDLFCQAFRTNQIRGVVITGVSDPEAEEAAKDYGVDGQKYSLIEYYLSLGGELDASRYSSISVKELYALIEKISDEEKDALEDLCESILDGLSAKLKLLEKQVKTAVKNPFQKKEAERFLEELEDLLDEMDEMDEGFSFFGAFGDYGAETPAMPQFPAGPFGGEDKSASGGDATARFLSKAQELSLWLEEAGLTDEAEAARTLKADAETALAEWEEARERLQNLLDFDARREEKEEEIKNSGDKDKKEDDDFDYDDWQERHEEEFMLNWYKKARG